MLDAATLKGPNRKDAALRGFIENHVRSDLSPFEQACCYKTLVEKLGFGRKELAARIPINRTSLDYMLDYMIAALDGKSLTPKMIQAWKERKLGDGHVLALFRLREQLERRFTGLEDLERTLGARMACVRKLSR